MNKDWFFLIVILLLLLTQATVTYLASGSPKECCSGYPADLVCKSVCEQRGMNYSHYEGYHTLNPDHQIEDLKCVCENWKVAE